MPYGRSLVRDLSPIPRRSLTRAPRRSLRVTEDEDMIMVSGQYVGHVRLTIVR
jgi:hypothetical protein